MFFRAVQSSRETIQQLQLVGQGSSGPIDDMAHRALHAVLIK